MDLELIKSKIYEIRGQRVMLDHDLAVMYGVETKRLNEAVKRNSLRFEGDDFMFQLTKEEAMQVSRSRSQIATLNNGRGSNIKYLPYAFTELNESTRAQIDAISEALAELQTNGSQSRPRRRIGFVQDEDNK